MIIPRVAKYPMIIISSLIKKEQVLSVEYYFYFHQLGKSKIQQKFFNLKMIEERLILFSDKRILIKSMQLKENNQM